MKRLTTSLLAASLLVLAASCGNDTEKDTSTSDTMNMSAPATDATTSPTGPMADSMASGASTTNDNTGGGISTGAANSGTSSSRTTGASGRRGTNGSGDGMTGTPSQEAAPVEEGGSTYRRAEPGDPVDGRTPMGSSR